VDPPSDTAGQSWRSELMRAVESQVKKAGVQ
jgi:hypothetical protein